MVRIGTTVYFEAAHRQLNDSSKCGKLHGHNWKVDVEIESNDINEIGYVVDFKEVGAICNRYDHAVLLVMDDPLVNVLMRMDQKVVVMEKNPTCENLAMEIAECIMMVLENNKVYLDGLKVVVWENEKSFAVTEW